MALKLNLNEPVTLALTRSDPKPYTYPNRPPSYMYSVVTADGAEDKAFLSASCSQTLAEMQIQPREWFTLCRRKTPQGQEYYEVQTSATSQVSNRLPAISAPQHAASVPAPRPQAQPPQPPQQHRASLPAPKPPTQARNASTVMGAALIAAFDAVQQAQQYAASQGMPVEFRAEDVRAIAATIFIAASRDPLFAERVA